MEPANQPAAMAEAMNRLWQRFLPEIEERVAILESAAASLARGSLSSAEREQAGAAAHKLAGVLGTFGLQEGTVLAREAELFYLNDAPATGPAGASPTETASQLRAMIANRR